MELIAGNLRGVARRLAVLALALAAASCGDGLFDGSGPDLSGRGVIVCIGRVRDAGTGAPINGVAVHLQKLKADGTPDGAEVHTVTEDYADFGGGHFDFNDEKLTTGVHRLRATHALYQDFSATIVLSTVAESPWVTYDFTMTKR